jgi:hypothetical protein
MVHHNHNPAHKGSRCGETSLRAGFAADGEDIMARVCGGVILVSKIGNSDYFHHPSEMREAAMRRLRCTGYERRENDIEERMG